MRRAANESGLRRSRCRDTWDFRVGIGFSIELKAFPIDGRLVVLAPDADEGNGRNSK
jgi:hypothetical protein